MVRRDPLVGPGFQGVLGLEGQMMFGVGGRVCHPVFGEDRLIVCGAVHSARDIGETTARWLNGYRLRGLGGACRRPVHQERGRPP